MQNSITKLKHKHKDQDIWVLAAGPSLNYIDASFFSNKITIGVNRICKFIECNYVVAKDGRGFGEISSALQDKTELILSKHESGNLHQNINSINYKHYIFEHPAKPREEPDLSCISQESDKIVVSYSTITSAIHLAAYLGAKNIIIVGHDCGTIDNQSTIEGYYNNIKPHQGTEQGYINWLSLIENHTALVSAKISKEYGCNIHSLNPFINLNLEGHTYVPSNRGKKLQRKLKTIGEVK